jgi:metallophosphoesterase superfamily enzyme
MPAFGAYTGGLNVLDDAFGSLFLRRTLEAWMLGKSEVYPIGVRALLPD